MPGPAKAGHYVRRQMPGPAEAGHYVRRRMPGPAGPAKAGHYVRRRTLRTPGSTPDDGQDVVAALFHQRRRRGLEVQPQQRLRVRRPDVEVPVWVIHRDAIEPRDLGVAVARLDRRQLLRHLVHARELRVDLARDEVALAIRLQQIPQR